MDLRARAEAACRTMVALKNFSKLDFGNLEYDEEDKHIAAAVSTAYVEDSEKTSKAVSERRFSNLPTASMIMINNILQEYGHSVAEDAQTLRNVITNKLLIETDHPDAKVRLRAMELLGKISDVGLFTEKSEVTVTHQDTSVLRQNLKQRLEKLVGEVTEVEDAEVIDDA